MNKFKFKSYNCKACTTFNALWYLKLENKSFPKLELVLSEMGPSKVSQNDCCYDSVTKSTIDWFQVISEAIQCTSESQADLIKKYSR